MLAARRGARVVSYEPNPELIPALRANTAKWGVDCRQAAVVGEPVESVTLYVHPDRDIRSSTFDVDVTDGSRLGHGVEVPAVPIADVLAEPCDLLKLDCEGGEFAIFAAGRDALRNAERIIAEIHTEVGDLEQARAQVEAAGFDVAVRDIRPGWPLVELAAVRRP